MHRYGISLITILCLSAGYRLYAWVVVPHTTSSTAAQTALPIAPEEFRSPQIAQKATQYFPDAPWTQDAKIVWQRLDSAMMFMNQVEREQTEIARDRDGKPRNLLRVSPLAMVWVDKRRPDQPPFRLQAREAIIEFENPFSKSQGGTSLDMSASPGRIVWAALEGDVLIDGPDGLTINGKDFRFSEESGELYSDDAIDFRYGPSAENEVEFAGSGNGITVTFQRTSESHYGNDMPRIGELARIVLRKQVELNARFQLDEAWNEARLTTQDAVEYDATTHRITFNERVSALRREVSTAGSRPDSLRCEWLQIELAPVAAATEKSPGDSSSRGLFSDLEFRRLRALWTTGHPGSRRSPVVIESQERGLTASMQDLIYDSSLRRAVFVDPEQVEIRTPEATLLCPQIRIQHGEQDTIERLECLQAGKILLAAEALSDLPAEVSWSGNLDLSPDPETQLHRATIQGDAQVNVPEQVAMLSEVIEVWADLAGLQGSSREKNDQSLLHEPLPIQRMRAAGHVRMASPQLDLRDARLVDVTIRPGTVDAQPARNSGRSSGKQEESDLPWLVDANQIQIELAHDSQQGQLDLRSLQASGGIHIEQQSSPDRPRSGSLSEEPVVLDGWALAVVSQGGTRQVMELRGETGPMGEEKRRASFSVGQARLEGMAIHVDRAANEVTINGRGGFRFPITLAPEESASALPVQATTAWQDRMVFDGKQARFFGKVTCSVPRDMSTIYQLQCEELSARLTRPVSLTDPDPGSQQLEIDEVSARHQVRLEAYGFTNNVMDAIHDVELADFTVSRLTGKFYGQGLGRISSWRKGQGLKLSPNDSAAANQPVKSSAPGWQYAYVEFAGHLEGNWLHRDATLHDRIKVISAPVSEPRERFDWDAIDDIAGAERSDRTQRKSASDAFCLTCGKLNIVQRKYVELENGFIELTATDGPDLQAQMFRAVADELIVDQRNRMFVLRGLGTDAQLWLQKEPGELPAKTEARLIQYIPANNDVRINGFKGFSGSR